jgi:rfaE bifunctional protein kinase chain/domain
MAPLTLAEARPLLAKFPARRVTVVGDLVADHYLYGQTDRVSREAPVLIVRHESSEVKLGGAANAAANVRSLGGQVRALGVLGNDAMGEALRQEFSRAGIELQACTAPGVETETKMRILAGGLNTTRQQMLRVDRGNRRLPPALSEELRHKLLEAAKDSDAILVSDYGAGVVDPGLRGALREVAHRGIPVCADSRYALAELIGLTVCKPNEPELQSLTGIPIQDEQSLAGAARRALELLACRYLLVTRGRHGAVLFESGGPSRVIPVHGMREAVDVTGAGDTVIAALTLAMAGGASAPEAAELANVAGAVVVQKQGTAAVTPEEVLAELSPR